MRSLAGLALPDGTTDTATIQICEILTGHMHPA
jgi:hypothetical protein